MAKFVREKKYIVIPYGLFQNRTDGKKFSLQILQSIYLLTFL